MWRVKQNDLRKALLFGELTASQLQEVAGKMRLHTFAKGETIFTRGAASQALYGIETGWVQLLGEAGLRLATLGPGTLLGDNDMLDGQPYAVTAVAAETTRAWELDRQSLGELIAEDPETGLNLSRALGRRLPLLDDHLVERRLRSLPALAGLGDEVLRAIAGAMDLVSYPAQGVIFREGECASGIFVVENGSVQVFSACGRDDEFAELSQGAAIGEMATLTGKTHMASARALQESKLWLLPPAAFAALKVQHPTLAQALSRNVRERLSADDQAAATKKLQDLPLFAGLPAEALSDVASVLLLRHVRAGEMVYQRGDVGDALYLIESGSVRIVTNEQARDAFSAPLSDGDFFGETALLSGKTRSVSVRAETDVNLWVLYRSDFERLVTRYPAISLSLSRLLSERLAAADRTFVDRHLRKLSLLAGLTSSQLEDVSGRLRPVKYRAGEIIINEGVAGDSMYLIEAGAVEVSKGGTRPISLATLRDGDFFGEMALLTGRPRMATVKASTEVELWELRKPDFDALLLKYPSLTIALSKVLGERLANANGRLVQGIAAPVVAPTPEAAPTPAPVRRERTPMVQRTPMVTPSRSVAAPAARPSPGFGLQRSITAALEGLRRGLDDAALWFGERSTAAKIRLVAVVLLLAWLCGVAAPAALISALAANDVNYASAASLAFLERPAAAVMVVETKPQVATLAQAAPAPAVAQQRAVPALTPVPPTDTPEPPAPTDTPEPPAPTETPVPPTPTNTVAPPTPTATYTPLPVVVAQVAPVQAVPPPNQMAAAPVAAPKPARGWDGRLDSMRVQVTGVDVAPGQAFWRVAEVRWENEQEALGKHHIYVEMVDENGNRLVGQRAEVYWSGGQEVLTTENKPAPEFAANFPMYAVLGTYSLRGQGLPSESVVGMGMGTPELPAWKIHTNFFIKLQRTIR
jgi:CRP-like cAMP-binding protein